MKVSLFITIVLGISKSSESVDIYCNCYDSGYSIVGTLYTCFVQNDLTIDSYENALVSSVKATHKSGKTNEDVTGVQIINKKLNFFPRNLEKHLTNLKAIWLLNANLKEISQMDLKPFPQLEFFGLPNNNIEILEEGLFDYNTKLKGIWLYSNRINHIDATIFDKLTSLTAITLYSNTCIESGSTVQEIITTAKASCQNKNYLSFNNKLKNLENLNKDLNSNSLSTFIQNLKSFEDEFIKSEFSYLTTMKLRLKHVNSAKNEKLIAIKNYESQNETNFCENFTNVTKQIVNLENTVKVSANETLNAIQSKDNSYNEQFSSFDRTLLQLDKKVTTLDEKFAEFDEKVSNFMAQEPNKGDLSSNFDDKVTPFEEILNDFQTKAIKKFGYIEAELMDSRFKILKSVEVKYQQLEKLMVKKIDTLEKVVNEKLEKIMKALNVEE